MLALPHSAVKTALVNLCR